MKPWKVTFAAAALSLCMALPAHAILWTLTTTTLQSGTFDYDATLNKKSSPLPKLRAHRILQPTAASTSLGFSPPS